MKAPSQTTLVELARAGAVRGHTLHGRADSYALSVQYGLHEAVLTAKRGGTRRFARLVPAAPAPRAPHQPGRAGPAAHAEAATPPPAAPRARSPRGPQPLAAAMPLSIRRAKVRAAALLDAFEVGDTWGAHAAKRALDFERRWAAQVGAPRGLRAYVRDRQRQVRDTSPTFARLHRSIERLYDR